MEAGTGATMAYPLGHDTSTEILLKAVRTLRNREAGNDIGTAVVEVEDIPSLKDTQIIENRYVSGNSIGSPIRSSKVPTCVEVPPSATDMFSTFSTSEQETNTQMYDAMGISGVATYPTVPKLQSSEVTDNIHEADALTMPRRKPSSTLSHNKLTKVIEHKPPTYRPTGLLLEGAVPTISITETDEVIASDDAITSISNMPPHLQSSRTSTMCSAVSAKSHQEPGPIHISPSAQIQSVQSISELDARLNGATSLRKPWRMSRHNRTSSQATYTSTGTPISISNVPLSVGLFEAHSRLNDNILSQYVGGVNRGDWTKSSEWVEPCAIDDGPKEWIEDFLTRQEQADRDEDRERQRQEKQDKRYGGIRGRVNSADKFRRKLSMKRVAGERGSFEARQERRKEGVFDINIGSSPDRRASIPIPGEDLERPTRERAFSWTPDTHQPLMSLTTLPNRSSWTPTSSTPASSSPLHRIHAADRLHMSLPSQHPSRRTLLNYSSFTPNHHRSTSALQRVATRQPSHTHLRTSSWEKLKVKKVTSIGSDVKRNISSSFAPAITEGKDSVKDLIGRVEKVGESVTRKLSASWKGKWRGLGKKKSMNVGGMHIVGREC